MAWDYPTLYAQIARGVAGDRTLSPATLALCLAALSRMDTRETWANDGLALTDAQWDTAANWLATAYNDLLVEIDDND